MKAEEPFPPVPQDRAAAPDDLEAVRRYHHVALKLLRAAGTGLFGTDEDVQQEANIAVLQAHKEYRPAEGDWEPHMNRTVKRRCNDALARVVRAKPTPDMQAVQKVRSQLRPLGRDVTVEEMVTETGLSTERVEQAVRLIEARKGVERPEGLSDTEAAEPAATTGPQPTVEVEEDASKSELSLQIVEATLGYAQRAQARGKPDPIDPHGALALVDLYFRHYGEWSERDVAKKAFRAGLRPDHVRAVREAAAERLRRLRLQAGED